MACCAMPGGCGSPICYLCTVVARQAQPIALHALQKHERAELRDSKALPDLSGPRAAATSLAFVKRTREGAFRKQRS